MVQILPPNPKLYFSVARGNLTNDGGFFAKGVSRIGLIIIDVRW